MRYVVREKTLLQIPAAAKRQGDIPAYSIRDCAVQIQNLGNASKPRMKTLQLTRTTANVDDIIRKHDNSDLLDIPLWFDGHAAFRQAGLYTSSASVSDDVLVKIITPSAFAGGLIRVRPSSECQSALQQKHPAATMPYGLNGGVDLGEMVVATVSTIRQALTNTGWLFFPAFMDEGGPQDPGRLLYMKLGELSHLVKQHIEWTTLPVPEPAPNIPPGWTEFPQDCDLVTQIVQEIIGINEVDVRIGQESSVLYLLEATEPLPVRFYLYDLASGDLFTITEPNTYDAILEKIRTDFDGLKRVEFVEEA